MPTANQIKMAKVRAERSKAPKPKGKGKLKAKAKKGGCSKCPKNRNMNMAGEGAKIDATVKAIKTGVNFVVKNRKQIAQGVSAVSGLAGDLTGNKTLKAVSSAAAALGKGRDRVRIHGRGGGPTDRVNTGMQATPMIAYPNAAAPFTGSLVF